ncbi:DNA circularization N-terminal domain-containing protein [Caballeronia sp. LZ001]|uniref:DNA circularization protein n=1 Tax=Caballeronia sp. LZ001 TaxID=3038553 RepID=UPI00286797BB|nr:DNA circularization N-terminal domain-containing protein [Caballeronia sp. LZ001]MDR5803399.1 DNA circularization N-terminal domain-containing protein [Caballeronia sp. LZ001]
MAWKDLLLDASFRGVTFDVLRTEDSIERDTAAHGVPHVDGEDIEDLGLKPHELSITAIFFGDDYELRMRRLLDALAMAGPGELVHPVFGSLPSMQLLSAHVVHDADNVDACRIDMRFKRSTPSNPFFTGQHPAQAADALAQHSVITQDAGTAMFSRALDSLHAAQAGLRRLNALRDLLTQTLAPLRTLAIGFRSVSLDYLVWPGAFVSDMAGMLKAITDLRSFDRAFIMSDWKDAQQQIQRVLQLPLTRPFERATMRDTSARTQRRSLHAADPTDAQLVKAVVSVVVASHIAELASDVLGNEIDTPTLCPDHVEQIANDTRRMLQSAIDTVRGAASVEHARPTIEALKDTAQSVQVLAIKVIDALPPIISRAVVAPTNLTLLAHGWYGDYARFAELVRLNPQTRNPNFIEQGTVIRGFAQ